MARALLKASRALGLRACVALALAAPARAQTAPVVDIANPIAAVPLASLNATRDRPLFAPTRRPPPPPPAAAPVEAPTAVAVVLAPASPPFSLLGTVIAPDDRIAILKADEGEPTRLREGKTASGWMLVSVGRRSVVMSNLGREVTLAFPKAASAPSPAPRDGEGLDAPAIPAMRQALPTVSVALRARRIDP